MATLKRTNKMAGHCNKNTAASYYNLKDTTTPLLRMEGDFLHLFHRDIFRPAFMPVDQT